MPKNNNNKSQTQQASRTSTMRLSISSISSIALLMASALGIASAQDAATPDKQVSFGICTCFRPKYDASCCMLVKGYMMNDGNVCDTPDATGSIDKFEACCTKSGGKYKCKHGYRDPSHWPPEDSYGCSA
ncbi:hypothetical protein BGZ97_011274 [Linnemannia gamsii]|jgi:hypothetical protein|uniref:Uncharacterized protein n=1 Tax=Linnemannia gamsii TaxID=64522 RepID=A0A9P6R911_9FUNG|nr:hypothetical protein BGZ97_011274 [Linnemannia gamsii]